MAERRERLIDELYLDDPERADAVVFGRRTDGSRRGFLGGAGLTTMGAVLGAPVVRDGSGDGSRGRGYSGGR
jgi:hypothetical protein